MGRDVDGLELVNFVFVFHMKVRRQAETFRIDFIRFESLDRGIYVPEPGTDGEWKETT